VLSADTTIDSKRFNAGDMIRVDGGMPDLLRALNEYVAQRIPGSRIAGMALFAFDTVEIQRIGIGVLNNILGTQRTCASLWQSYFSSCRLLHHSRAVSL